MELDSTPTEIDALDRRIRLLQVEVEALKKEVADKEAKLQDLSRLTNTVAVESSSNPTLQRSSSSRSRPMN